MSERLEEMGSFFDARVEGYDEHMVTMFQDFKRYYETLAGVIEETERPIRILDLGCGTGAELEPIFRRAPNAVVTGIDLSERMLEKLVTKYEARKAQFTLICDSYLTIPFGESTYDYVLSVYTMHHFTLAVKVGLYQKIRQVLKPGGCYIEGDCVVTPQQEDEAWAYYTQRYPEDLKATLNRTEGTASLVHIDLPCTVSTQRRLFREAGFTRINLIWYREEESSAIFVVAP